MAATTASPSVRGTNSPNAAARPSSPRARRSRRRRLPSLPGSTMRASARCSPRTAIKRTGRDRFVRNVLIAIGNSREPALAAHAERLLVDPAPLVRGAAVWALSRLVAASSVCGAGGTLRSPASTIPVRDERNAAPGHSATRAPRKRGQGVSTLLCLGFGYSAQHYVAALWHALRPHHRHDAQRRQRGRARGTAVRRPSVEMIVFDGKSASPPLDSRRHGSDACSSSRSRPTTASIRCWRRSRDAIAAAPQLAMRSFIFPPSRSTAIMTGAGSTRRRRSRRC